MTGQQLYEIYTQAHAERNCGVDAWEDLTDEDRCVWDRIAELIIVKSS